MARIEKIRPSTMKFHYQFPLTDYTCYKLFSGTCSLEAPFDETVLAKAGAAYYRQKESCQSLYIGIKKGLTPPVEIVEHGCGHYSFVDGQHRVCIAQMKDIEIVAEIIEGIPECCFCASRK